MLEKLGVCNVYYVSMGSFQSMSDVCLHRLIIVRLSLFDSVIQQGPQHSTCIDLFQLIVVARTNITEVSRRLYVDLNDIDDNFPSFLDCGDVSRSNSYDNF